MKILDGKSIAKRVKDELKEKVARFVRECGREISLAVVMVGNNSASAVYVRNKIKAAEYVGIRSLSFVLPEKCWTENYFYPRESAIKNLMNKYAESDTMKEYAGINRHEVELFLKYKKHYGYVFYIGRAV